MRKTILSLCLAFLATASWAAPAKKGLTRVIRLTDGTELTVELKGDEFLHYYQAADGNCYTDNGNGTFVPFDLETGKANAMAKRAAMQQASQKMKAKPLRSMQQNAGPNKAFGDGTGYYGKKKGLIILVEFPNKKFKSGHDNEFYTKLANKENYVEGVFKGSVRDYYYAQSNGQFELTFDVIGPITAPENYNYYGQNNASNSDSHVGTLVAWACKEVKDKVDFHDYDWDGDGYADQVFVLYAGLGEASGGDAKTVWPHEYQIRYTCVGKVLNYTAEGKGKVDTYACANEMERVINEYTGQYTSDQKLAGIGTICHEFSHCLGFADMYDTTANGGNYGMGFFDVMASGSYNGGGFIPCNYNAYERIYAGWTEPIVLEEDPASVEKMMSTEDYGRPFIIYNDKHPEEFFTLENREKKGWDAALYGSGMMITHVDYDQSVWGVNQVNASASDHQRCTIFHADNDDNGQDLGSIQNDLYPYMVSGAVMNDELTDDSRPAAKLYNKNADGTKYMGKPVTAIRKNADGTMSFDFMGGSEENILDNTTKKEETAIKDIKADTRKADNRVYSIDGRYLGDDINALGKGLYIVGGKKELKTK